MKYQEFMQNNNRRRSPKRVNISNIRNSGNKNKYNSSLKFGNSVNVSSGDEAGQVILDNIKDLEKKGLPVHKVVLKTFKNSFLVIFKVVVDAIEFIGGRLQMHYCGIKDQSKRNKFINSIVVGALVFLGGFCVTILNLNSENKALANQVNQLTIENEGHKKTIELEIEDNTKSSNTKENNNVKTEASSKESTKNTRKVDNSNLDELLKGIKFSKKDGDKTTNTVEIRYKDKTTNEVVTITSKAYGIFGLSTIENKKSVTDFIKYVKETDIDFYEEYFDGVDMPGTVTFDTGWYGATKTENEKFKLMQIKYVYNKYIEPTVSAVKREYGIDLMSTTALKELVFSTAYDYGKDGTLTLFKNVDITSSMSEKEIIEKVQKEKIDSLGKYTYTNDWKYTDEDRANVKSDIEKELKELLALL